MDNLNQLYGFGESINDTNPPTLAQQFANKNPSLMLQYDIHDSYNLENTLRRQQLMLMLRSKYPNITYEEAYRQASNMLSMQTNIDAQRQRKEKVNQQNKGMFY